MQHDNTTNKTLSNDILVVCAHCKKVLINRDSWEYADPLFLKNRQQHTSHGICPDCLLANYPNEYLAIQEKKRIRIKKFFNSKDDEHRGETKLK